MPLATSATGAPWESSSLKFDDGNRRFARSRAPWFYGNLGYGIHHAGCGWAGSLLSPIDYIANALGVYLATCN
jgi:hypothetical protein